jgi:hypothetical protein
MDRAKLSSGEKSCSINAWLFDNKALTSVSFGFPGSIITIIGPLNSNHESI